MISLFRSIETKTETDEYKVKLDGKEDLVTLILQ